MPVDLLVKAVPDDVVDGLRRRAALYQRSLEDELLAILTEAAGAEGGSLTPEELLAWARQSGLQTPADSADIIRSDRDGAR